VIHWIFLLLLISFPPCISIWAQTKADSGRFDGPAELPRQSIKTALSDTPAHGKSILVKNSGELGGAIEKAACGDTIRLQAGAEFAGRRSGPGENPEL
jgi:hypothetical protein